jgi:hypothetical protein
VPVAMIEIVAQASAPVGMIIEYRLVQHSQRDIDTQTGIEQILERGNLLSLAGIKLR